MKPCRSSVASSSGVARPGNELRILFGHGFIDRGQSLWSTICFALVLTFCLFPSPVSAQPAPSTPPEKLPEVIEAGIRPDAFFFVDEFGNKVMQPGLTFEKIDRLLKAESGFAEKATPYTYEGISITGTARENEAELSVTIKLNVAATPGQYVAVPLAMKTFHLRGPADVTGVEESGIKWLEEGGSLLWVRADQPRKVEVIMRVVTRVSSESGPSIDFRLPQAPTNVSLNVLGDDLTANVVGRGDEVVRVGAGEPGNSKVEIECTGGDFVLQWQKRDTVLPSDQVLEVDSRHRVVWEDPQAPPTVTVDVDVQNRRGNLGPFELVLPPGAELLEPLQNSPSVILATRDAKSGRVQVDPIESEATGRVKFTVEYQLPAGDYRSDLPLRILPVDVPNSIRHSGEIEIRIDRNYRLRWLQSPWVRSAWPAGTATPADQRISVFQFDRVPFELPLWLIAKQQRLRIEPEYTFRLDRQSVALEGTILVTGAALEGIPLLLETPGWQINSIVDAESGRRLDDALSENGEGMELILAELASNTNSVVMVRLTASLKNRGNADQVEFQIPDLRSVDDRTMLVAPAAINIFAADGLSAITDLQKSVGLVPLQSDTTDTAGSNGPQKYRLQALEGPAKFFGYVIEKPIEAIIEATVNVGLLAGQLQIIQDWNLSPRGNLKGQIPLRGASSFTLMHEGNSVIVPVDMQISIDDKLAVVRWNDAEKFTVFSEGLATQPCRIRMVSTVPLPLLEPVSNELSSESQQAESIVAKLVVVRPDFPGGRVSGAVPLNVMPSSGYEIALELGPENAGQTYDAYAQRESTLRIKPRLQESVSQLLVDRAVMRSEVGRSRRYDRLLSRVTGNGNKYDVEFQDAELGTGASDYTVRVYVDNVEIQNFTVQANGISVPIDDASRPRLVDIRVWQTQPGNTAAGMVEPALRLPITTGKTYWDVVLPSDRHLLWSASGSNELMLWRYGQFFVQRVPTRTHAELLEWIGGPPPPESQGGNRYLLVSSDAESLMFFEAGRPILWLFVAGMVLSFSSLLFYVPSFRHPLIAIAGAVLVGGMAWLIPDLAVITGQLFLAACLLIAVMVGVRAIISRRPRATVLGGVPEATSGQSGTARRGSATVDPTSTRLHEAVTGGSTAGAQS